MKKTSTPLLRGLIAASVVLVTVPATAQTVQFGQPSTTQGSGTRTPLAPVNPAPGGATYGQTLPQNGSTFDPYATQPGSAATAPTLLPPTGMPPYVQGVSPGMGAPPSVVIPGMYPSSQAPSVFPNGFQAVGVAAPSLKLFQNIRSQYTWINGDGSGIDRLDIQDVEVATTMAFPNFIYSGRPLLISPGFQWHFWDGPSTPPPTAPRPRPDLPSSAYSAYVDFGWFPQSRFAPQLSGELSARVGIFSDFNSITSRSFRFQGVGLAVLQLTPTLSFKGGITYLDRIDLKLLPSGGFLWTPNPHTRWDIYFPRPKLSQFMYTVGNTDVWWYVGAEYGGGSWTINRIGGASDQVDINDYRAMFGIDWSQPSGFKGFFEAGYVFHRELVYRSTVDNVALNETIMARAGIAY